METFYFTNVKTSFGQCLLVESAQGITQCTLPSIQSELPASTKKERYIEKETPLLKKAATELKEYFEGTRENFDLPLDLRGTEFQKKVWNALQKIPYGKTTSYQAIAIQLKNPKGVRAIGHANAKNPIPILVPCHRVIGKDGSLTGFGGGTQLKHKMLLLEQRCDYLL
jgi:methylated-DNA-[protein]-cysteine S-methyltransferase